MNEHGFIKAVHRHLSPEVYRWKIHDTYTGGVPDAFYMGPAGSLFVEYKYVKLPKRNTTVVTFSLSKLQVSWLTRAQMCGQLVAVIVGFERSAVAVTDPQFFGGISKRQLHEEALSLQQTASWIERHVASRGSARGHQKPTSCSTQPSKNLEQQKR